MTYYINDSKILAELRQIDSDIEEAKAELGQIDSDIKEADLVVHEMIEELDTLDTQFKELRGLLGDVEEGIKGYQVSVDNIKGGYDRDSIRTAYDKLKDATLRRVDVEMDMRKVLKSLQNKTTGLKIVENQLKVLQDTRGKVHKKLKVLQDTRDEMRKQLDIMLQAQEAYLSAVHMYELINKKNAN